MRREFSKWIGLAAALALSACTRPGGPDEITVGGWVSNDAGQTTPDPDGGVIDVVKPTLKCNPTNSSEIMKARSTITTGTSTPVKAPTYFTSDLFNLFKASCGSCHVESSLGNPPFNVSLSNFKTKVDQSVLDVIKSDNDATYMPPMAAGGIPFSQRVAQRGDADPVVHLATMLELWIQAGSPADSFELPSDMTQTSAGYALSPDLGNELSNIGSCVPDKGMVATNGGAMDALDTMFASATELPATLDKTDLFTLDSEALAREGVISYAPTYPLWTDNAGKMRYVRVPRGKSISFDKTTQQFTIPANTRFYKTFLKQVTDANGNVGYRKIETRMIVSRPDVNNADGTATQTALYGTYVWNDDESQATLLTDPLRSGKPFADRIFTYITDEAKAQQVIDSKPVNLAVALAQKGVTRHYALPGAERCVQCHMGSPSQSFVLGFTPLQVNRRAAGTGGTYETGQGEELTQLQRLIDYGVITGMTSPADVKPLEQSQGARAPRTPEELNAQAYMVGNCSHCHNPRGLPSVKEPLVKAALDFLPGAGANEGIFQFPLDRMSPIRKRGLYQDVDIPYITPSLYDMPRLEASAKYFCPDTPDNACEYDTTGYDPGDPSMSAPPVPALKWVLAPWRSLIYRNTDTPYDYFDDFALFPHMPLNSPGYDCRAAKLMGDWMVSIPAVIIDPTKIEYAKPIQTDPTHPLAWPPSADSSAQPYREVVKGDKDYDAAVAAAKTRLDQYHTAGYRYDFCPNTYTDDIIDPVIEDEVAKNIPVATDTGPYTDPMDFHKVLMPPITPFRPHYVSFDDTDPPGDWFPRRPDWQDAIVNPNIPAFVTAAKNAQNLTPDEVIDLTNVLQALGSVKLTADVRAALTEQVPFGLWDTTKAGCNFAGVPTAGSFTGASKPSWMDVKPPAPTAPVYMQSAGAAVFTSICFNCHGLNADSKGLLAEEISTLTGGDARVADFRDGLFGPVSMPGANRDRVYGPAAATLGAGYTSDDVASRYLAWMALGGTAKHLPTDVLTQVSQAPVLGTLRSNIAPQGTPDMLRLGLQLCSQVATSDLNIQQFSLSDLFANGRIGWSEYTGLVDVNGDAEMWLRLCNLSNRPVVRVPLLTNDSHRWDATTTVSSIIVSGFHLYWGTDAQGNDLYGQNQAMDASGHLTTGLAGNAFPMCIEKPTNANELTAANSFLAAHKVNGNVIPFCPAGFITPDNNLVVDTSSADPNFVDGRKWAARGAVNAALAVFLYLDGIERDPTKKMPLYNQCNLLTTP
ncbi:MAG TPA: hypothetical protein VHJ20_03125 [Polyangia bacterium]|nr:hypothetical protein [Polyangia bacterium]